MTDRFVGDESNITEQYLGGRHKGGGSVELERAAAGGGVEGRGRGRGRGLRCFKMPARGQKGTCTLSVSIRASTCVAPAKTTHHCYGRAEYEAPWAI